MSSAENASSCSGSQISRYVFRHTICVSKGKVLARRFSCSAWHVWEDDLFAVATVIIIRKGLSDRTQCGFPNVAGTVAPVNRKMRQIA